MNIHDQKIINLIDDLMLEKSSEMVELKMHELFDLVATSPSPVDIEKLKVLRDLKKAFEDIKSTGFESFFYALGSLKKLY